MFWVGMASLIIGMPAVFASLGSFQGQFGDPFLAGQQMKVAETVIKDARLHMSKRARFAWRMITVGSIGIAFAAFIDILNLGFG
jgi:acyl dehydratase